ncbi:MAG: dTMP kinase [Phyllobacteriaceae bacterium]|nr:dTMP kinase [Phyllobacteriaceae bacterium]
MTATAPQAREASGPPARGRFVTFEGGEGAGKSSQIAHLAERLRGRGLDVVVTREPGGSPGAECIRHVLLTGAAEVFGPLAEACLFAAARADHVDLTIRPALARGAWVLSDRFYDSSRVYQGDGGVAPQTLRLLEEVAVDEVRPDLTLLLDVPAEIGLARAGSRRGGGDADRFEKEDVGVHERRRRAFLAIAAEEPWRFAVIDATAAPAEVAETIWRTVGHRLGLPAAVEAE